MNEYREIWAKADGVNAILAITLGVAVIHALSVFLLTITVIPHALVVPLAVVLGPPAVWGVALGAVFYELAAAGISLAPVVLFVDLFICAIIGRELWNSLPNATLQRPVIAMLLVIPVAIVASLVGAGTAVVLSGLLVNAGIEAYLPALLMERLLLATIVAPLVLGVGYGWNRPEWDKREMSMRRWFGTVATIGIIATGWIAVTFLFSLVRRDVQLVPDIGHEIAKALPYPLDMTVTFTFGPYGWIVHPIGAVFALCCVGLILRLGLPRTAVDY